jgi:hypothetical protein
LRSIRNVVDKANLFINKDDRKETFLSFCLAKINYVIRVIDSLIKSHIGSRNVFRRKVDAFLVFGRNDTQRL